MENKYDEFYFENDTNYPAKVYWNLYDEDNKKAIEKYDGHMFCPLCKLAPLTVAKGNQRRYFKVVESDMDKHSEDCSYRNKKATKRETRNFYDDLDKTDIKNRLISCLNRMLKKTFGKISVERTAISVKNKIKSNFFDFKGDNYKDKYLPHKNFNVGELDDEIDVQKIYYGKCSLYMIKYISDDEGEVKKYFLKVLDQDSKKQICDIVISPTVYNYLKNDLNDIPEDKENAENYYLCFSGILEKNGIFYKCKLKDSRLIVLEKE